MFSIREDQLHLPRVIAERIAEELSWPSDHKLCQYLDSLLAEGRFADALLWSIEIEARLEFNAMGQYGLPGAEYRSTQAYRQHVAQRLIGALAPPPPPPPPSPTATNTAAAAKRCTFEADPGRSWQAE